MTGMDSNSILQALTQDGDLVTDRLAHWASARGERTCIHYGEDDVRLSFAQLHDISDAIAGNLAAMGVCKGTHVSVFTRNQLVAIQAMFGIWKAGAVYCPTNYALTGRLLAYQLKDAAPALMIVERALVPALAEVLQDAESIKMLVIYDAPEGAHDHLADRPALPDGISMMQHPWERLLQPARRPDVPVSYKDPANIIYTSGTTGPAKGVVQPHRWMNQYTFLFRQLLDEDDVIYNDLPMYHVGGAVYNVVRGVWAGCATACWDRFSPNQFWHRIRSSGATSAVLVDTMIAWLAKMPESPADRNHSLNKVHMQPLPARHTEIAQRFGFDFVTAGFGQTESGLSCFTIIEETDASSETPVEFRKGPWREEIRERAARYHAAVLRFEEAGSVGKGYMGAPSLFAEAAVLDDDDNICPPDRAGQLAFRPRVPFVFLEGYLNKPEATVKAFRNLWFHTGDAARTHENGTFTFVDRMGDRIRVRGENIASFDVEDMLNQHEGVAMTAAFAIPAEEGDEDDVVVYVVPREDAELTEDMIATWAAEKMPKYMRPRHVRIVDELPRTATQKVEKFRLRQRILEELQRP